MNAVEVMETLVYATVAGALFGLAIMLLRGLR